MVQATCAALALPEGSNLSALGSVPATTWAQLIWSRGPHVGAPLALHMLQQMPLEQLAAQLPSKLHPQGAAQDLISPNMPPSSRSSDLFPGCCSSVDAKPNMSSPILVFVSSCSSCRPHAHQATAHSARGGQRCTERHGGTRSTACEGSPLDLGPAATASRARPVWGGRCQR